MNCGAETAVSELGKGPIFEDGRVPPLAGLGGGSLNLFPQIKWINYNNLP